MAMALDITVAESLIPLSALGRPQLLLLLEESETLDVFKGCRLPAYSPRHYTCWFLLSGTLVCILADGREQVFEAASRLCALPLLHHRVDEWYAREDSRLLQVNQLRLDQLLTWSQTADCLLLSLLDLPDFEEDRGWISALLRSNLFFKIPPLNLLQVIDGFVAQVVEKGEVVVREGEVGNACYFIKEGEAIVSRHAEGPCGIAPIAVLTAGACFGEDALINDSPRNATVTMTTSGVLMVLHKSRFLQLLKAPPKRGINLHEWLKRPHQLTGSECLVDVRTAAEYEFLHLPGAINMPLGLLWLHLRRLPKDRSITLCCDTGNRSEAAAHLLRAEGFDAHFIEGGLNLPLETIAASRR